MAQLAFSVSGINNGIYTIEDEEFTKEVGGSDLSVNPYGKQEGGLLHFQDDPDDGQLLWPLEF